MLPMSTRLFRTPVLLLTLLAFLLASPGGSSAYVFCIGADGHAAFELDHDGGCGRDTTCPTPEQSAPHCDNDSEHGTPCTDIQPSLSSASPRSKPVLQSPPPAATPLCTGTVPPALGAGHVTQTPRADQFLPCNVTLQVLRSTVIRC